MPHFQSPTVAPKQRQTDGLNPTTPKEKKRKKSRILIRKPQTSTNLCSLAPRALRASNSTTAASCDGRSCKASSNIESSAPFAEETANQPQQNTKLSMYPTSRENNPHIRRRLRIHFAEQPERSCAHARSSQLALAPFTKQIRVLNLCCFVLQAPRARA